MKGSSQHAFDPQEVMAYLDGELEPQQATALAAHLEHCSECQTLAAGLRQVSERLLDFQVEPCLEKLAEPVLAALNSTEPRAEEKSRQPAPAKRRPIPRGLAWAAGSAASVVALLFLLVMFKARPGLNKVAYERVTSVDGQPSYLHLQPAPPLSAEPSVVTSLMSPGAVPRNGPAVTDEQSKIVKNWLASAGGPELRGPMIVQTASVTIVASNYDQASGAIEAISKRHGGYVQDMNADTRTGMSRSVSATLRIPENQVEAALSDLRKLGHVEQETRNNQEITDQYVDLTARLRSARATEQRILQLLATRTGKLSDVLEAEQELARVRGEIESMDGQRVTMERQVRYATVQVQLSEVYREQLDSKAVTRWTMLRNSVVDGLRNLVDSATWLLTVAFSYGPSALLWLAILGTPAWFIWRRYRRSRTAA
jgi:Domain of unknown function (DUF4349)/Putative zinc-finger